MRYDKGWGAIAVAASLLLHFLLLWALLRIVIESVPPPHFISVVVVRPPPPPKPAAIPKPKPVPKPVTASPPPVSKPIPHAAPGPVSHAKPYQRARPARSLPPPSHFGTLGAQAGLGLDLSSPGGGGNGTGSIGDFDDAVKQRIQAAKTYPPGIPYMWNECVVEYQVTVDRNGQLLSYKLYGCDDPFLDSAARAAILEASPFPVPPDFGGTHYTVFGSLVFKHSEDQP